MAWGGLFVKDFRRGCSWVCLIGRLAWCSKGEDDGEWYTRVALHVVICSMSGCD